MPSSSVSGRPDLRSTASQRRAAYHGDDFPPSPGLYGTFGNYSSQTRNINLPGDVSDGPGPVPAEESAKEASYINVRQLESGEEKRTSIMIRNIPNRYSEADLVDILNSVCPSTQLASPTMSRRIHHHPPAS